VIKQSVVIKHFGAEPRRASTTPGRPAGDAARGRRFDPPLTEDDLAFYDAVIQNESAVTEMGDDKLADIARDLVRSVRRSISVDWTARDDVRARLRTIIKRLLAVPAGRASGRHSTRAAPDGDLRPGVGTRPW
jgi:hypothetical protein